MPDNKTAAAGTATLGGSTTTADANQPIAAPAKLDMTGAIPLDPEPTPQSGAPAKLDMTNAIPLDDPEPSSAGGASGSWDTPPDNPVLGVLSGIGGAALETVEGAKNLVNKALPASAQIPNIPEKYRVERNTAESIGGGLENIAEFYVGDAALEGIEKAAKLTALAKKYPLVAEVMNMAKEHPVLAKIIAGTSKGGTVGAAQGALKGSAEGQTEEGAIAGGAGGAIGGAAGSVLAETASAIAKPLAEKFGVGTEATADAVRGARPGKRNYRFASDFQRAAPYMDAENVKDPSKTIEDWADTTSEARKNLYTNKIQPLVDKHATEPLGGLNIAEGIRKEIPDAMKIYDPDQAKKMEELANQFMPGQKFQLQVKDAEDALQHFNAKLASTGFWSKMPNEREALLKTDGTISGLKAAGDAIRDELYDKLDTLEPGSGMAELKKDYGALRNVENEIRGRVNVSNRQSPISLKETIGLITGLGHGGPVGAAMATLPILERFGNSPENLIARGVQKAARPGEEGAIAKTLQKGGKAVAKAAPVTAALTGSQIGQAVNIKQPEPPANTNDGAPTAIPVGKLDMTNAVPLDLDASNLSDDDFRTAAERILPSIGHAEGADIPGSLPARTHNPGDLAEGDRGAGVEKSSGLGATNITKFRTDEEGREANVADLVKKLRRNPELTIAELGKVWAPADSKNWSTAVAKHAGLTPDDKVIALLNEANSNRE